MHNLEDDIYRYENGHLVEREQFIQDLINYFKDKKIVEEDIEDLEVENKNLRDELESLEVQLDEVEADYEVAIKELEDLREEIRDA